ncbi:cell division protein PerM [Leucobacter tenebrionis]|uniref:cell division protein PerM n=1 Tax=Leucobacter tenebrionis TaxID=2873270 RepID=UPI001CA7B3D4|nr:DUF6350 family protein [Leucobacter tenebrionis]QZY52728.1 DUF6350 family protein [Leucobacter tenebrionis]
MRAIVTAVVAAIEAAAVAVAGLAAVTVPALLLWTVVFGLAAEPNAVVAAVAGAWLLAHRVPMRLEVDAQTALSLGLAPEQLEFVLSLAPLGITLITVLLAARAGWRFGARGGIGAAGALGGMLGFGAVAFGTATLAAPLQVWPLWLAALVPAVGYGAVSTAAFCVRAMRDEHDWWRACVRAVQRGVERAGASAWAAVLPARAGETGRLAVAMLVALLGLAGLAFAVAIVVGYPHVIALTQGLHLDPLGSVLVFIVQVALLPVAVIWGVAWLTGAGFSVGAGSSATPFEALLGPLPALPLFGAIPQGWGALGALVPALLVLTGVAIGVLFARRPQQRRVGWIAALVTPVVAALLVGLAVAALCALASGSIGPGRLETAGAEPWIAGGLAAAELGAGALLGIAAARIDLGRIREALPETARAMSERVRTVRVPGRRRRKNAEALPALSGLGGDAGRSEGTIDVGVDADETVDLTADADAADALDALDASAGEEAAGAGREREAPGLDGSEASGSAADGPAADDPDSDDSDLGETADLAGAVDDLDEQDSEALLRAYAWDGRPLDDGDPEPPHRSRWRRGREER